MPTRFFATLLLCLAPLRCECWRAQGTRPAVPRHALVVAQLFGGGSVPQSVAELIDPSISIAEVAPLWKQFRACYPSEAQAIAAAKRNPIPLLPFLNTADNIRFNRQVLKERIGFSDEEILDIITKNPGVLGNQPGQLARASKGEVLFSLSTVAFFDAIPAEIRGVIPALTGLSIVGIIAKRLTDCAGGTCG